MLTWTEKEKEEEKEKEKEKEKVCIVYLVNKLNVEKIINLNTFRQKNDRNVL